MTSPFPGMDPFIEASGLWEDFHTKLIGAVEEALSQALPERYCVRLGERFYVVVAVNDEEKRSVAGADVGVAVPRGEWAPGNAPQGVAVAEPGNGPVSMRAFIEESFRETFLEIREVHSRRLVTAMEVLSPANKRPGTEGWRQYQRKRQACISDEELNFIEIDLMRGGQRMPMMDPWPAGPYYFLVKRQGYGQSCKVWPVFSLTALPPLVVPLIKPDPDVTVAVQPLIDNIYRRSRYDRDIDYRTPPKPTLDPTETAWLEQHLATNL